MSQSDTWIALQIARDARLSGRMDVYEQLLPEVECEYVRRTAVQRRWRDREWLDWHPVLVGQAKRQHDKKEFEQMMELVLEEVGRNIYATIGTLLP